ncbi:ATP-binding protein [Actinomadura nitritigenes]|uniref:ATP-binding protein n=1 Tax=Actinomadura nitritigenes TaxID=134602 RepID=UPI003D915D4C
MELEGNGASTGSTGADAAGERSIDIIDPAAGGTTARRTNGRTSGQSNGQGNGPGNGQGNGPGNGLGIGPGIAAGNGQGAGAGERRAVSWELPAERRTAARARALTAQALDAWHVTDPGDVDDIVLMVDELVTNAVVHGTGPVRLGLRLDGARLTGEVGDADPAAPGGAPPAPPVLDWAEAGRGLLLVTALATGFGARTHPTGKTVWFTRDLHRAEGTPAAAATPPVTAGAGPAPA